ncbi:MAG: hypothetical protein AAGF91_12140 [Actinomycetota bacterium]
MHPLTSDRGIRRRGVATVTAVLALAACASGDGADRDEISPCADEPDATVCTESIDDLGSDELAEVAADLDAISTIDLETGVCASGGDGAGGDWGLCVVPIGDEREAVVGRADRSDLRGLATVDGQGVTFPLPTDEGVAVVVNGGSRVYDVLEPNGSRLGSMTGPRR